MEELMTIIRDRTATVPDYIQSLLDTGKYHDMTVTCGGETFKLHRNIVCSQSEFFARAVNGHFKESEAGIVNLPEDDLDTLMKVFEFMYKGHYGLTSVHNSHLDSDKACDRPNEDLLVSARVHIMADKFLIPQLKSLSLRHVAKAVSKAGITKGPWKFSDFPAIVAEVYSNTTRSASSLRESIRQLVLKRQDTDGFWDAMQPVMRSYPEFTLELLNDMQGLLRKKTPAPVMRPGRHSLAALCAK